MPWSKSRTKSFHPRTHGPHETHFNTCAGNSGAFTPIPEADVVLKERRPLVLMLRETPLHAGHLENLLKLARLGAVIAPPAPAFYIRPKSVDDLVDHAVGRVLDLFDIDTALPHRWREAEN